MPRVSSVPGGYGPRHPGLYERLLERKCGHETEPDPRLVLTGDPRQLSAFRAMQARGEEEADRLLVKRLAAGKPITAARWEVIGGHHGLPRDQVPEQWEWVRWFTVTADDEIVPCPEGWTPVVA